MLPQIAMFAALAAIGVVFAVRSRSKAAALGNPLPGLQALAAGFATTRQPGETEPVCVVAFHITAFKAQQVTVGVTNQRVLVVKGGAPLHAVPYDDAGEHLPSKQKTAEKRGFFRWMRDPAGYKPVVQQPPFAGEAWLMPVDVAGYPQQRASLRELSDRFYFQWFYD